MYLQGGWWRQGWWAKIPINFCYSQRHCLKMCFAILYLFLLGFRAYNDGLKGPHTPETYFDKKFIGTLSFTSCLAVWSEAVRQQDFAILSPEGSCDSTFHLRMFMALSDLCREIPETFDLNFKDSRDSVSEQALSEWGKLLYL